jgi:23S rRNA (cytosine1962-C5)-methyltransferase
MNFQIPISQLPQPSQRRIALRVTPAAERALRSGHPWVYDQAIKDQNHPGAPGDLAVIFDRKRNFIAVGLFDPDSPIRVRILQTGQPAAINQEWFLARLEQSFQIRNPLRDQPEQIRTTGYRLVHGENDGLPGLVIDRYASTLVMKLYTSAWIPHLQALLPALAQTNLGDTLILRLSRSMSQQAGLLHGLNDGLVLAGELPQSPLLFSENGLWFEVDPVHGQKTGFFLDQRDNRSRLEHLSNGKSVLNLFAYTGGFSVYAARGGAREVVSVDISAPAIQSCVNNMAHNYANSKVKAAQHETICGDVFEVLASLCTARRRFDVIVIDPPMFAQNQSQIPAALSAYRRLTRLGLEILRPGGTLVQASCSSRIDPPIFFEMVNQAAREAGRPLREIERTGHALDHPIRYKEGAYLKCLFAIAP